MADTVMLCMLLVGMATIAGIYCIRIRRNR